MCVLLAFLLFSMKASPTSGLMGRGLGPGDIRRRGNYRTEQAASLWAQLLPPLSFKYCFVSENCLCPLGSCSSCLAWIWTRSQKTREHLLRSQNMQWAKLYFDRKRSAIKTIFLIQRSFPPSALFVTSSSLWLAGKLASDWSVYWLLIGQDRLWLRGRS